MLQVLLRKSEPEQPLGVAACELDLVLVAQGDTLEPLRPGLVRDKRPVHRKKYAIDSQFHDAAEQGRIGEIPAGGDIEVLAEDCAEAQGLGARAGKRMIDPPYQVRQRFAEMAENNFQ